MSFWDQLKRRQVFKVGAAYLIVAWLIVQVVSVLSDPLSLPDRFDTVVVVLLAVGFPIALILAWAYEITPEGVKAASNVEAADSVHLAGQRFNYVITGLLVVAVAFMAVDTYVLDDVGEPVAVQQNVSGSAGSPGATPLTGQTAALRSLPKSVAVIPFENLSPDPDNAFFAMGIHEEILNQLVRLSSLNVISRTTMRRYAGTTMSIPEIARELNVGSVMEGSVRRDNDRVIVTVQLIDPMTDLHLWSESYERRIVDVFAIQRDVASNVALALEAELSPQDRERLTDGAPTTSQEAYELYLGASAAVYTFTPENYDDAIARLDRALQLDSSFAEAWSLRSTMLGVTLTWATEGFDEIKKEALDSAARAVELRPDSGSARTWMGLAHAFAGNWVMAERAYRQAIERGVIPPEMHEYSTLQMAVGNFAGAKETLDSYLLVDPQNPVAATWLLVALEGTGDRAARRSLYERGRRLHGDTWLGIRTEALIRIGERDFAFLRGLAAEMPPVTSAIGLPYLDDPAGGLAALREDYADPANRNSLRLLEMAEWSAYFGDADFALRVLGDSLRRGSAINVDFLWLPAFDTVRALPDFEGFVRDLGLDAYWREYGWPEFCQPLDNVRFECH